jgi:hypothetical protein
MPGIDPALAEEESTTTDSSHGVRERPSTMTNEQLPLAPQRLRADWMRKPSVPSALKSNSAPMMESVR